MDAPPSHESSRYQRTRCSKAKGTGAFVLLRFIDFKRSSHLNLVVAYGLEWAFHVLLWIEDE
ncbi:hypothetical protein SynPROSU1_01722 [Synechococcus sp. PROS-U-1]|nr:hypothetical protein SynPROSU1_01722 [Synechococcus sp. PROS-U-1]